MRKKGVEKFLFLSLLSWALVASSQGGKNGGAKKAEMRFGSVFDKAEKVFDCSENY